MKKLFVILFLFIIFNSSYCQENYNLINKTELDLLFLYGEPDLYETKDSMEIFIYKGKSNYEKQYFYINKNIIIKYEFSTVGLSYTNIKIIYLFYQRYYLSKGFLLLNNNTWNSNYVNKDLLKIYLNIGYDSSLHLFYFFVKIDK